jgi:hypothetical protein
VVGLVVLWQVRLPGLLACKAVCSCRIRGRCGCLVVACPCLLVTLGSVLLSGPLACRAMEAVAASSAANGKVRLAAEMPWFVTG